MLASQLMDADIIDYPELANIYGGFAMFDTSGNGYLTVPVQDPDPARGKGRRAFDEDQRRIQETMAAWGVKAFQIARAAGWTVEAATRELKKHAVIEVDSVRALGRRACPSAFGVTAAELEKRLRHHVDNLRETKGQEAVDTLVRSEFTTFGRLGRVHLRSRDFDARLYEAFHGRLAGSFHDKMADALNPRPTEMRFPLPEAVHLSFATGVNLAFLWQEQWLYRLILGAAAALNAWTHRQPASLLPEECYALFRCVETAVPESVAPDDDIQHEVVKRILARLVDDLYGDRTRFLANVGQALHADGLLPNRPHTVCELMRRCVSIVDDDGVPEWFAISPLR